MVLKKNISNSKNLSISAKRLVVTLMQQTFTLTDIDTDHSIKSTKTFFLRKDDFVILILPLTIKCYIIFIRKLHCRYTDIHINVIQTNIQHWQNNLWKKILLTMNAYFKRSGMDCLDPRSWLLEFLRWNAVHTVTITMDMMPVSLHNIPTTAIKETLKIRVQSLKIMKNETPSFSAVLYMIMSYCCSFQILMFESFLHF